MNCPICDSIDISLPKINVLFSIILFLDPHKLGIRCRVNGNVMQDSNTENLVFKTEKLISFISR